MEYRQFVYLDDLAVRSLLASMGIAVPEEIEEIQEDTTEIEGEGGTSAGINLPYIGNADIGGELSESQTGREMLQTRKRISDQYNFDVLHKQVKEDINRPDKDGLATEPGKIVKITGTIQTDAIYRLLKGISMIGDITDIENIEQIRTAERLLYKKGIGVSINSDETHFSCVGTLNPEKLWIDEERAFLSEKEYTVFGRVYDTLDNGEKWDYLDIVKIADTIIADKTMEDFRETANELINTLGQTSEEYEMPDMKRLNLESFSQLSQLDNMSESATSTFELSIDEREIAVEAPGVIIDPIAIYW